MNPTEIVRTVRNFIRWHREKFDALDEVHEVLANPIGYQRGEGDKREFWIEPTVWTEELCSDEIDPQDAARTLKELGLLRTQDDNSFQIVAKIRGKSRRVYSVSNAILTWRRVVTGHGYNGLSAVSLRMSKKSAALPGCKLAATCFINSSFTPMSVR